MEIQDSIFAEFLNEVLCATCSILKFQLLNPVSVTDLIVPKVYLSFPRIENSIPPSERAGWWVEVLTNSRDCGNLSSAQLPQPPVTAQM